LDKYPSNLRIAVENALAGLQTILHKTHEAAGSPDTGQAQDKAAVSFCVNAALISASVLVFRPN
jgi:hypothetical protein